MSGLKGMKAMRIVFILLALCGFFFFGFPIFRSIFNVGNAAGLILSAVLMLIGIFWASIGSAIHTLAQKTAGRVCLTVLIVLIALLLFLGVFTGILIVRGCSRQPSEDATVIVLGCQVKGERPSRMLTERIDAAYDWMEEHPQSVAIVSGGQGEGEDISEAQCMRDELVKRGIPEDRILMEDKSTSTRENIAFSKKLIREKNLSENVAVVTNEFHIYRSIRIAEKAGLKAGAVPAKTAWFLLPTFFMREQIGILYEWVTG